MTSAWDILEQEAGCTNADIKAAAQKADKNPTDAEIEAENYKKGHINLYGLDITIENAKGGTRAGIGKDGKRWEVTMPAAYGYVKGTKAVDGDQVDVYIGDNCESDKVWVVDQCDHETKKYDEPKCMICFPSKDEARSTYIKGFNDGKGEERIMAITEMTVDAWKEWLDSGDTKKPLGKKEEDLEEGLDEAEEPKKIFTAARNHPDELVRRKLVQCGFTLEWRNVRGERWRLIEEDDEEHYWRVTRYWNESRVAVWDIDKLLGTSRTTWTNVWSSGALSADQAAYKLDRMFRPPKGWEAV